MITKSLINKITVFKFAIKFYLTPSLVFPKWFVPSKNYIFHIILPNESQLQEKQSKHFLNHIDGVYNYM